MQKRVLIECKSIDFVSGIREFSKQKVQNDFLLVWQKVVNQLNDILRINNGSDNVSACGGVHGVL